MFLRNKKGQSMQEFIAVVAVMMLAFFIFQKYIWQSINGRWKTVGDSLGSGKYFDPEESTSCRFFKWDWVDSVCFDQTCEPACFFDTGTIANCYACTQTCRVPQCEPAGCSSACGGWSSGSCNPTACGTTGQAEQTRTCSSPTCITSRCVPDPSC